MGPSETPLVLAVARADVGRALAKDFRWPFLDDPAHVRTMVAQGFSCVTLAEVAELECAVLVVPGDHDVGAAHQLVHATRGVDPLKLNADLGTFGWVTDSDGRLLLVRQAYGPRFWALPGGEVQVFEAPTQSVAREVHEESGYMVRADGLLAVYGRQQHVGFYFACALEGGNPREAVDTEIEAVGWFDPDDLPDPHHPVIDLLRADMAQGRVQARFF